MRQQWYRLLIVPLLSLLCITGQALAANGKITGVVKSGDGEVAAGANVVVEGTTLGGVADANGRYFVLNVPPGTYRVRASAVGFAAQVVTDVRVGSDQIVTIDFTLQEEAVGLTEVVVRAERPAVDKSQTSARTRLAGDDFQNLPVSDVGALVATSASTYKGFVRGGRLYETKTIVDGIDLTDQFAGWANEVPGGAAPYMTYNGIIRQTDNMRSSLVDLSKSAVEEANVLTGGVGSDYSSATAGVISYSLREGRGAWTGRAEVRVSQTGGLKHYGPGLYNDDSTYFAVKRTLAASTQAANREKAARFTFTRDKYSYGVKPEINAEFSTGGSVTEDFGLFISGRWFDSHGRLPNEFTRRANASLKANYSITPEMKLNATFLLEDRGKLLGWKNRSYVDDFRFFLEGVPKWDGANIVGSLKWTHVLSPGTFYEVQTSLVDDNSRRGFSDDNNDGIPSLYEDGDYLTFADTAQVNRYMANAGNAQFSKFFSPTPRNETGSELGVNLAGQANWKVARPGIFYENFKNRVFTAKGDFTSQLNPNHQLRAGLQVRLHDLDRELRAGYIGGVFGTYKNYVEEIWNVKPREYGAYVQDRMEYAGLIINAGLRLDALDIAAGDYANYFAPFTDVNDASGGRVRVPTRASNAKLKWFVSPRLGVSHPISDVAAMYFSFSQQQQPQPFSRIYANYMDFGNPSLPVVVRTNQDPIRSTNYDLGLQWSFAEGFGLDINAFYKDIQSYGVMSLQVTPNAPWRLFIVSTDFGYADSRGIELTINKNILPLTDFLSIGGRFSYAYSYIKQAVYAGGNTSTFSTGGGDSLRYVGQLPFDDIKYWNTIERNVLGGNSTLTGGYDRPHRITYNLFLRFPYDIQLSSIGTFQSGFFFPMTLADPRSRELGEGPWNKRVDLRLEKGFSFEGLGRVALYVDLVNAFNWVNIIGYNSSNVGQLAWERNGDPLGGPTINRVVGRDASNNQDGSLVYDIPREIYFGVNVSF